MSFSSNFSASPKVPLADSSRKREAQAKIFSGSTDFVTGRPAPRGGAARAGRSHPGAFSEKNQTKSRSKTFQQNPELATSSSDKMLNEMKKANKTVVGPTSLLSNSDNLDRFAIDRTRRFGSTSIQAMGVTSSLDPASGRMDSPGKQMSKKYYTSYSKLSEVKLITIGIASPLRILQWAEKTLPNGKVYGEVLNANTLHHKTFKPQIGGLFCERIFGPLKDFECACENTKMNRMAKQDITKSLQTGSLKKTDEVGSLSTDLGSSKGSLGQNRKQLRKYCPKCNVEYTWSVIRRYQLGYIKLSSPVTHVWFLKGTPSYLSLLLDMKKRHLQLITYCSETLTIENALGNTQKSLFLDSPSQIFASWKALWEQKTENQTLPKQKTNVLKRLNVKPVPNKDWKDTNPKKINPQHVNSESQTSHFSTDLNQNQLWEKTYQLFSEQNILRRGSKPKLHNRFVSKTETRATLPLLLNTLHLSLSYDTFDGPGLIDSPSQETLKTAIESQFTLQLNSESSLKKVLLMSKINTLIHKLPVDGYILCHLERTLHKKMIIHSVLQTWEKLYSTAYMKALNEVTKVYLMFLKTESLTVNDSTTVAQTNETKLRIVFDDRPLTGAKPSRELTEENRRSRFSKSILYKPAMATHLSQRNQLMASNKMSNFQFALKSVKKTFKKHVLQTLQQTKQPLFLFNYTTNLNYSNFDSLYLSSPLWTAKTEQSTTHKTQNGLSVESELLVNVLCESLKKTLFLQKLVGTNPISSYPVADDMLGEPLKNKSETEGAQNSIRHFVSQQIHWKNKQINQLKKELVISSPLLQQKALNEFNRIDDVDSLLSNLLTKECYKRKLLTLIENRLRRFSSGLRPGKAPLAKNDFDQFNGPPGLKRSFRLIQNRQSRFASDLRMNHDNKTGGTPKGSTLYNTIYTLSHRERWESEKDWQIFMLYNGYSDIRHSDTVTKRFAFSNPVTSQDKILTRIGSESVRNSGGRQPFSFSETPVQKSMNDTPILAYQYRVRSVLNVTPNTARPAAGGAFGDEVPQRGLSMSDVSSSGFGGTTGHHLSNAFYSGPGIIQQLLNELTFPELKKLDKQNRLVLYQLNQNILKLKKQVKIFVYDKSAYMELKDLCKKRDLLIRRTKLVRKLFRKDSDPSSMILTVLPVLPPDLRPIVKMGSQIAASDLNRLYQQVIYRNERLKFFLKDPATSQSYEMKYAQRLLQEAVDNLIQNSKTSSTSEKDSRGRALKSLSDSLKGKQGRFRQFLLGKRVDYSGRSVIVVGPKLKLHECGLPLEMALELYLPFLLKRILNKNYAKTVIGAKALIKNNAALAHELLREIMLVSPVLLNRAPTLHRLGIQAFVPKLVEGRAILLHPLVCSAFNADFDGDQMAVHIPITVEARAEAWKLMLSRNNILAPSTGDPLAIPSQDMVLGCYYLTTYSKQVQQKALVKSYQNSLKGSDFADSVSKDNHERFSSGLPASSVHTIYFKNLEDVMYAYNQQKLKLHTLVFVKWNQFIENGNDLEEPIELRINSSGQWQEISSNYHRFYNQQNSLMNQYMVTTPGRILFNLVIHRIQVENQLRPFSSN